MHLVFWCKSKMHLYFVVLDALVRNLAAFFLIKGDFCPQKRTFLPFIVIRNNLFCRAQTCLISGFCRRDIHHKYASRKWQMQKRELFCLHARRSSAWQNLTSFLWAELPPCRALKRSHSFITKLPPAHFHQLDALQHFSRDVNKGR